MNLDPSELTNAKARLLGDAGLRKSHADSIVRRLERALTSGEESAIGQMRREIARYTLCGPPDPLVSVRNHEGEQVFRGTVDEYRLESRRRLVEEYGQEARRLFFEEELTPGQVQKQLKIPWDYIVAVLGFDSREAMYIARNGIGQKQRSRSGYYAVRPKILERDAHRCVLSGRTEKLEVHHIDGQRTHNDPSNLVTLHQSIHKILTRGKGPQPVFTAYLQWVRSHGHPDARLEHCPGCHGHHLKLEGGTVDAH